MPTIGLYTVMAYIVMADVQMTWVAIDRDIYIGMAYIVTADV